MSEDNVIPMRPVVGSNDGKPHLIYDPATMRYGIMVDSVEVISGLDPLGRREHVRAVAAGEVSGPHVDIEPPHFAVLRHIAEGIRARGDCGCSVVLPDGVIATLSLNTPDPFAAQPSGSDPEGK